MLENALGDTDDNPCRPVLAKTADGEGIRKPLCGSMLYGGKAPAHRMIRILWPRIVRSFVYLTALAGLSACSGPRIVEDTPAAVSIRYDGVIQTLENATAAARRACARYGKTAQLRRTEVAANIERYAHFDCR